MQSVRQGAIHLFRVAGVDVSLHWSWFLVAAYEIQSRKGDYSSILWNMLEYLALFLIVLTHEFGHAMACRQVGGRADKILLWPFGGVAYVDPPQRPGATLWSIAAGPLVNVVLLPVLIGLELAARAAGWPQTAPDLYQLLRSVLYINASLLVFNILPIYPLDGGQILRSLLWFMMGRARSLMVATILGMVGIVGFFALALWQRNLWLAAVSVYLLMSCWGGLKHARELLRVARLPRRSGVACPSCRTAPPIGPYWRCGACGLSFDMFEGGAVCQHCTAVFASTSCLDCGRSSPVQHWIAGLTVGAVAGGDGYVPD
jgi:Zn-dependent protease